MPLWRFYTVKQFHMSQRKTHILLTIGFTLLTGCGPSLQFTADVDSNIRSFVEDSSIIDGEVSILVDFPDLDTKVFEISTCDFYCAMPTTYYGISHGSKIGFLVDYIYVDSSEYKHLTLYDFDQTDAELYSDEFIAASIEEYGRFMLYSLARDADTPRSVLSNIASGYYYGGSATVTTQLGNEMALVLLQNPTVLADEEILALIATHGGQAFNGDPDARIQALELLNFQLPEEDLIILRDKYRMEGVEALQDALIAREGDLIYDDNEFNYPLGEDLEAALVPKYLSALPTNPITGEQYHYAWYLDGNPQSMMMQVWVELETYQPEFNSSSWGIKANLDTTQPGWAGDTVDGSITTCTELPNDCIYDLSSLWAFMDEL